MNRCGLSDANAIPEAERRSMNDPGEVDRAERPGRHVLSEGWVTRERTEQVGRDAAGRTALA
jgi:hypothetical protein